MKKIVLFALLASFGFATVSCSGDDSSEPINQNPQTGGTVTLKVNGEAKNFNTVNVNVDEREDEGVTYLIITATADNNPAEMMSFVVKKGDIGVGVAYNFRYMANGKEYLGNLNNAVQTNGDDRKLIGSFSGEATTQQLEGITITEGIFNIIY